MTTLPPPGFFDSAALGQAGGAGLAKDGLDDLRDCVSETIGQASGKRYSIDSGGSLATDAITPVAIAPDVAHILCDTAPGQTEDNLARIPLPTGSPRWLWLQPAVSGHTVIVLSSMTGDGEIVLSTAGASRKFKLTNLFAGLMLYRSGSSWKEAFRSYGSDSWGANANGQWAWERNGVLRQWGKSATQAAAAQIITLPKPFLTADFYLSVSEVIDSNTEPSNIRAVGAWGKTTTSFKVKATTDAGVQSSVQFDWQAWGYAE